MTRKQCEKKIKEHLCEILKIYKQYLVSNNAVWEEQDHLSGAVFKNGFLMYNTRRAYNEEPALDIFYRLEKEKNDDN